MQDNYRQDNRRDNYRNRPNYGRDNQQRYRNRNESRENPRNYHKDNSRERFIDYIIDYIISSLTSQLCTASRKVMIKYVGLVFIYKIIDPHNYLLMTLDGKILRGLFEHERTKPAIIRMDQRNVHKLAQLKQIINTGLRM